MNRQPLPVEPRLMKNLCCILSLPNRELQAATLNFSYSGLGVVLPEDASEIDFREIHTVTVNGIGKLQVIGLWRSGFKIGLKFVSRRSTRPILDAYFKTIGEYPI